MLAPFHRDNALRQAWADAQRIPVGKECHVGAAIAQGAPQRIAIGNAAWMVGDDENRSRLGHMVQARGFNAEIQKLVAPFKAFICGQVFHRIHQSDGLAIPKNGEGRVFKNCPEPGMGAQTRRTLGDQLIDKGAGIGCWNRIFKNGQTHGRHERQTRAEWQALDCARWAR